MEMIMRYSLKVYNIKNLENYFSAVTLKKLSYNQQHDHVYFIGMDCSHQYSNK